MNPTDWTSPAMLAEQMKIIGGVFKKHGHLIAHAGHTSLDDAAQIAMGKIHHAHQNNPYDASKGPYTTWVGRIAFYTLRDILRSSENARSRDARHGLARAQAVTEPEEFEEKDKLLVTDKQLTNSPATVASIAKVAVSIARGRMGVDDPRAKWGLHQLAAILVVQRHVKRSLRGMVEMMQDDPGLRDALGLREVPPHVRLYYARERLPRGKVEKIYRGILKWLAAGN